MVLSKSFKKAAIVLYSSVPYLKAAIHFAPFLFNKFFLCGIINISAGIVLDKESVRRAVEHAEEKGVLVVASVGNDYAETHRIKYFPAAYPTVFAVGSLNTEESKISDFSQRGEWVDIYYCGEEVNIKTLSGSSRTSDGTSYSAAAVTALAANIIHETNGDLTPSELRQSLLEKAEALSDGTRYIPKK